MIQSRLVAYAPSWLVTHQASMARLDRLTMHRAPVMSMGGPDLDAMQGKQPQPMEGSSNRRPQTHN